MVGYFRCLTFVSVGSFHPVSFYTIRLDAYFLVRGVWCIASFLFGYVDLLTVKIVLSKSSILATIPFVSLQQYFVDWSDGAVDSQMK